MPQDPRPRLPNVYIIGAPSTGKSTLVDDLEQFIISTPSSSNDLKLKRNTPPTVIREVARDVLTKHGFTREEIRSSKARCFQLQQYILQAQFAAEQAAITAGAQWTLSDRSAIDPLVFTKQFVGAPEAEELQATSEWGFLSSQMKSSLVLVCEAGVGWLVDDGTRLMPVDKEEWMELHRFFCRVLEEMAIPYTVVPNTLTGRAERVQFAYQRWEELRKRQGGG